MDSNKFDKLPNAVVDLRSQFSTIWILPILALLIGGGLVYKSYSEKGPVVNVTFKYASGIEAGKTAVKYRDIKVGQVDSLTFSDDLSHILVSLQMNAGVDEWLTESTQFWVVKPRVEASGGSGLSTLLSGT